MEPSRRTDGDPVVEGSDDPTPGEREAVDAGLHAFNRQASDLDGVRRIGAFARVDGGELVGGAVGRTWGAACELQQLWVREDLRRRGLGARLVAAFEEHARRRGCTLVYLDTFSWQAPAFYAKLGYEVACELGGFPRGDRKFIFRKTLSGGAPGQASTSTLKPP